MDDAPGSKSPVIERERTWQMHCLAGPYRDVGMGLFALPRSVIQSPWYLLIFDIGTRAGVFLFTRAPGDDGRVISHEWMAPDLGDLPSLVFRTASSGAASVDDVESVLRAACAFVASEPSIAPISTRGAFGRPYDSLRGQWARALVVAR